MSSIDDNLEFILSDEQRKIVFENLDDNKKLSCLKAFKVAKKMKVQAKDMSAITKSLGVKITDCELGVFGSLDFLAKNEEIYNRLKKSYKEQRIPCKNLWQEAKSSSLRVVGSTVKNSDIEVSYCQLGCFREKKGLKSGNQS
ncbi:ModE family transcriptional regulator [Arcobacter cryaerophilus gv. occultus]|uniref:ModE family transcriptional regulator n=1 Tax=Aliarcobacter cryaerophilus TaxID=28198 RepID=UPI000D018038|nr:ModE family transcriptional regulator [Aliarcobacter cryaerophilus]PRM93474.1 ModE family transcriptional regulator [Arcobacter cryaerophilus gv. occultus]